MSAPSAGAPVSFADVVPGDTAAVLAIMRNTIREIDAGLGAMQRRDTVLAGVADSAPTYLTVWLEAHLPRKLVVSDSSETTGIIAQTTIWFVGGDVTVVQQPSDMYAFDADRLILWTNETLQPRTDLLPAARMARETLLIDQARRWLKVFGVALP